jgi:hypothetical protein
MPCARSTTLVSRRVCQTAALLAGMRAAHRCVGLTKSSRQSPRVEGQPVRSTNGATEHNRVKSASSSAPPHGAVQPHGESLVQSTRNLEPRSAFQGGSRRAGACSEHTIKRNRLRPQNCLRHVESSGGTAGSAQTDGGSLRNPNRQCRGSCVALLDVWRRSR